MAKVSTRMAVKADIVLHGLGQFRPFGRLRGFVLAFRLFGASGLFGRKIPLVEGHFPVTGAGHIDLAALGLGDLGELVVRPVCAHLEK